MAFRRMDSANPLYMVKQEETLAACVVFVLAPCIAIREAAMQDQCMNDPGRAACVPHDK